MKSDLAPALFFGITLALAVVGALIFSAAPNMCAFPQAIGETAKGGWCLEFWLNRYETLLGGAFTLIGAIIAAVFVVGQTRVARQQLGVMLGDIEPDFALRRSEKAHGFDIVVANQNRRPLILTKIAMASPEDALMVIDASSGVFRRSQYEDGGKAFHFDGFVEGTRPAAAQVSSVRIGGYISMRRQGGVEQSETVEVVLTIDFEIAGSGRGQRTQISARDIRIGGTHWSKEDAVGATLRSR